MSRHQNILSFIKSPISFAGWLAISLIFIALCTPLTFLPAPKRYENQLYFFLTTLWGKFLMFFSFIFVKVYGEQNLPTYPNSPAIIVVNHTSSLDIFVIESIMKSYPHIWLVKQAYAKIPLFSILVKRMHIPVQRNDSRTAGRALLKAYKQAQEIASHIIIFPEGKRYNDGKIHKFNSGFALLAKKLKRPVIPIAIFGFHKIMPKGTILIDYHATQPTMTIGKPLIIDEHESIEEFTRRVKWWFKEQIEKGA